ncbi:MAG: helix-turn-helix domain-containing protein [Deltaproteobacteria bacterium]|nr:helix-turn-helix domain-containing protein [Deltaproteobacteria bacterium]
MNTSVNSSSHTLLSPRAVAEALGVSESSVKRWCDEGRLRTVKTPGGHRRIASESVHELSRRGGLGIRRPGVLAEAGASSATTFAAARRDLVKALLRDDEAAALAILEAQRRAASGFEVVADEVVAPAMAMLGQRWAKGSLEIYEERRACGLLHGCLHALGASLAPPVPGAPAAIGGTLEGDPFTLATSLTEIVLREHGFVARSLGAWLPGATLARAIEARRPRLVWISVSAVGEGFAGAYAEVDRAARAAGAALVVGGQALDPSLRRRLRYSAFCDGMVQLASFAEALR